MLRAVGLLLAFLLAGCTTEGVLIQTESRAYAAADDPRGAQQVAVFVNWHDGCALGLCEVERLALHQPAAACIESGMRKVDPKFRTVPAPLELEQDTSALIADPRSKGQPDPRFHPQLVSTLRAAGISHAIVVDAARVRGSGSSETRPVGVQYLALGVGTTERTAVHGWVETMLIDLESQRWLGRARRVFRGTDVGTRGLMLTITLIPLPFAWSNSSSAATDACISAGEAMGQLLRSLF
jgi:hypothetical protein